MHGAAISINESEQLRSLREIKLLDTAAQAQFDAIVNAATLICGTSIPISLADRNRRRFSSNLHFKTLKRCADWSCHASV